jgi:RNA polymerase sigma-70 factor (ECF subfamily)
MREELGRIYEEHARSVYRYLFSLTRDADLAEELTQETFYRAVNSLRRYDGSCKISVWLCQIARHIWYQTLEKKRKRREESLDEALPSASPSPEEALVLAEDKAELYRAIHALPEAMREVVHMRLTGEFSFAEIGEILGKTESWARTTFYRAKQKIMEAMKC